MHRVRRSVVWFPSSGGAPFHAQEEHFPAQEEFFIHYTFYTHTYLSFFFIQYVYVLTFIVIPMMTRRSVDARR